MLESTNTLTLESLLQLPATVAIESPAEVMRAPEDCEPASWAYVQVDDAIAYRAAQQVLSDHADEFQDAMLKLYLAERDASRY